MMKAVIMAAGKGVRMEGLTKKTQKVLIKINGRPFLYYLLTNLQKAGYNDFGIITGYKKEQFAPFLKKYGFKATLIEQKEQLGTGHAALQAEEFVGGENFICMGGDNLWSVEDLKAVGTDDDLNYIMGMKIERLIRYGLLLFDQDLLNSMPEKPDTINSGLYKFTPEIFSALKNIEKSPRGEYEINDAIMQLAQKRKVKVLKVNDYWLDLGCPEDVPRISAFLKSFDSDRFHKVGRAIWIAASQKS